MSEVNELIKAVTESEDFREAVLDLLKEQKPRNYKPDDLLTPAEAAVVLNMKSKNPEAALRAKTRQSKDGKNPLKPTRGLARKYQYAYKDLIEYKNQFI